MFETLSNFRILCISIHNGNMSHVMEGRRVDTQKNNFNYSIVVTNYGENNVSVIGFGPIVVNNS